LLPTDIAESLPLNDGEREALAFEAEAFARAVSEPTARARFERLARAAAAGVVPEELVPAVETMLELVFQKGRPSNRAVLQAIFSKTPLGRQQASAAREVNEALRTLQGQTLQDLRLSAGPGRHTLVLETDRCRLTLELDGAGARVVSLEAG
jgi:hypothetical protein